MLVLAQRWCKQRERKPRLIAATVDHGLRKESAQEADAVALLCKRLKIAHRTLHWRGIKPSNGLQEAARDARYALLLDLARDVRADAIATAHTRDDQAETILHRLISGSGISGLAGIRKKSSRAGIALLRPLLDVPKARLVATLDADKIPFARDPSNDDPRFTRVRLRRLLAELEIEGFDSSRLGVLAERLGRADVALEAVAGEVARNVARNAALTEFDPDLFFRLPEEISIRLLRRAVDTAGTEGPSELGKLESLHRALALAWKARRALKQTLAGCLVTLSRDGLFVAPAPPRKGSRTKRLGAKQSA